MLTRWSLSLRKKNAFRKNLRYIHFMFTLPHHTVLLKKKTFKAAQPISFPFSWFEKPQVKYWKVYAAVPIFMIFACSVCWTTIAIQVVQLHFLHCNLKMHASLFLWICLYSNMFVFGYASIPFVVFPIWVKNHIFFYKMKYAKYSAQNAFKIQID